MQVAEFQKRRWGEERRGMQQDLIRSDVVLILTIRSKREEESAAQTPREDPVCGVEDKKSLTTLDISFLYSCHREFWERSRLHDKHTNVLFTATNNLVTHREMSFLRGFAGYDNDDDRNKKQTVESIGKENERKRKPACRLIIWRYKID